MDPERIESVKTGIVAAIAGIAVSLILVVATGIFTPGAAPHMPLLILQRLSIAAVCCFLFGVTYRYIIRQDPNPHLRSGAVGAFALTRSLSQLESLNFAEQTNILVLMLPIAESFGLFLVVRLILDFGLQRQWLKPFPTQNEI
ncbi:hypothetical protein [Leptothoe kymatousa]|uniref:Uncharacterized protein n=1 Tax=Leptothoe kymatousa TAU-MAC 1615 TaxID=2364775 RepID=A0ABS5Y586_9CYAN|nr:hypothetical protein [Leptothoe kymatousa]MBT9312951.1 hypothetical protein [Leptothoe kymatousa TAU-MAC 1615]